VWICGGGGEGGNGDKSKPTASEVVVIPSNKQLQFIHNAHVARNPIAERGLGVAGRKGRAFGRLWVWTRGACGPDRAPSSGHGGEVLIRASGGARVYAGRGKFSAAKETMPKNPSSEMIAAGEDALAKHWVELANSDCALALFPSIVAAIYDQWKARNQGLCLNHFNAILSWC
jgi:hypothetical protein